MHKIILLFSLLALSYSQQAEITNIQAAQRTDGSKLVDITYEITEDALFITFNVTVEVSFNGGSIYFPTGYVSGDVGAGITHGIGKSVVWNIGQEYNSTFNEDVRVKIIAEGSLNNENQFEMIMIPAGDFTYGEYDNILTIDYVYEMMKYKVTNAQYAEFLINAYENGDVWINGNYIEAFITEDGNWNPGESEYKLYTLGAPEGNFNYGRISWNGTTFIVTEGYGNHPVVHVTWYGAFKFANYNDMRLPTQHEWEKAARGDTGYDFPWGNILDGSRANYAGSGDPWDIGTTPVGFYNGQNYEEFQTTDSPSPYGVYDMVGGGGWEWTNYEGFYPDNIAVRGGSWDMLNEVGGIMFSSWFNDNGDGPSNDSYYCSFRCIRLIIE